MAFQTITLQRLPLSDDISDTNTTTTDCIALISLNRPSACNAVNRHMLSDLCTAFAQIDADPSVRAIVLTGGPSRHFCGQFFESTDL